MTAGARYRIAIVDDDGSVRKALQRLLAAANLQAETFVSGRDFLESLRYPLPDCLVLDLQLPGMTGLELQRELLRCGLSVPTVVVTGYDEPAMRAQCRSIGVAAYLCKPLDDRALLAAIETAVAGKSPWP